MAEALKLIYNKKFLQKLAYSLVKIKPDFQTSEFINLVLDDTWEQRELKDRMRHIANSLQRFFPPEPEASISLILKLTRVLKQKSTELSFAYMFIPDYIEQTCLSHPDLACQAMEEITQFTSCEFAVRPFIIKYPKMMMQQMLKWTFHQHPHVRRLASEGCRSRLPWAIALDFFKINPAPILPILDQLKDDPSEFVRKSVANNINDISKDHPALVIDLVRRWKGHSSDTDWILKHGSRTLLKSGHSEILPLFNFMQNKDIKITNLVIRTSQVKIGDALQFEFNLINDELQSTLIRLEYGLDFIRSNGSHSRKVFKISEKEYSATSTTRIVKHHSFRLITTRSYYSGQHHLTIIVNGSEMVGKDFHLFE
ncbi:MAG: DNA alkylation repair protein [Saprospiraceae bacterium]|nr:DNA alkylation repair protein [Saprospiraceae bacterium]